MRQYLPPPRVEFFDGTPEILANFWGQNAIARVQRGDPGKKLPKCLGNRAENLEWVLRVSRPSVQADMDRSRFCVTGLPRSRTCWLAALLCAHGVETLHEYPPFFDNLEGLRAWLYAGTPEDPHGYVDGFSIIHHAALLKQHFADSPIVVIYRDPMEVRRSWEAWNGPVSDEVFGASMAKVVQFVNETADRPNLMIVPYPALESYDAVNQLVLHCTDRPLKHRTWQLFHLFKIELHKTKSQPRPSDASPGL